MPKAKIDSITTPVDYSRGFNGTALKAILIRGDIGADGKIKSDNIIARCNNFDWSVAMTLSQSDEINKRSVEETMYGRQELGTGRIAVVFNLKANDALPTKSTLATEGEMTLLEVTGDDHPMTVSGKPTILNAFTGVRVVNFASATVVNQTKMLNVSVIFRERMNGAEWMLKAGAAFSYPAAVSEE